jgi:hypothetical protein
MRGVQKIMDKDLRMSRNMPPKKGTEKGKAKAQKARAAPVPIELMSSSDELPTRITKDDGQGKTGEGKDKGKEREVEEKVDADEVINVEGGSDDGEEEKERESSEEEIIVEVKRRTVVPGIPKKTRTDRVEEAQKKVCLSDCGCKM